MLAHTVIICNHPYFVIDEGFSRCLVWKWLLFLDWCREWFFFVIIFCSYCSTPFLPSPDQTPVQLFCSNFFPLLFNTTVHLLPSPAQHLFFPLLIKPWSTTSSIYCVTTSSLSCSTLLITFFPLLFNSPVSPSSLSCSTLLFHLLPSPAQHLFSPLLIKPWSTTSSLSCSTLLPSPVQFYFSPSSLSCSLSSLSCSTPSSLTCSKPCSTTSSLTWSNPCSTTSSLSCLTPPSLSCSTLLSNNFFPLLQHLLPSPARTPTPLKAASRYFLFHIEFLPLSLHYFTLCTNPKPYPWIPNYLNPKP